MSKQNTVSIAQRVENQRIRVNAASEAVKAAHIGIETENLRAARRDEEPRQDVLAKLEKELAKATFDYHNLASVLIGLEAMYAEPPIRIAA